MARRQEVLDALHAADGDVTRAAGTLGIPPGQAHMVATGEPADGSEGGSLQELVNPAQHNPLRDERVLAWLRERASRELDRPR